MKDILALLLFVIITFAFYGTFLFSIRARKSTEMLSKTKNRSLTNLSMGILLVGIATIMLLSGTFSTVRLIVAIVFYLIGLFNLYSGFKNYKRSTR